MTTALPLNNMEKPLTAPKPHGISRSSQESKETPSAGRQLVTTSKIKPPLLPKPILKPKPNFNAKSPVIKSPSVSITDENDIKNEISNNDSIVNRENLSHANKTNSIKNKLSIFQNSIEQNNISLDNKTFNGNSSDYNLINNPLKNSTVSDVKLNAPVTNIGKLKENYAIHINESSMSSSKSSETLITTSVSLKSRKEIFETTKTVNSDLIKLDYRSENYSNNEGITDSLDKLSQSETDNSLYNGSSETTESEVTHIKNMDVYLPHNMFETKDSSNISQISLTSTELSSSVNTSIEKTSNFVEKISEKKQESKSCISMPKEENYTDENILTEQDLNKKPKTRTPMFSFLHSKSTNSLISSISKVEINESVKKGTSNIEARKAFFEKIREEILSENYKVSEVGLLTKKHVSDDLWKRRSLGPHTTTSVSNERRWSLNSLKQDITSPPDSFNLKLRSPVGDESFRNELNNKLKRLSLPKLDDHVFHATPVEIIDTSQSSDPEEPIYWEIEDIMPNIKLSDATNNNHLLDSSQVNRDEDKDFPSDLSDSSDGSELSHSSWSDIEDIPLPNQSSTLHSLVKATLNLTDGIIQHNTSVTSNDFSRSNHKKDSISNIKRSSSGRSTKSRQEDVESIGSNSTESSYSMTKRLSSWFGSFGKGSKRSSLFYCESSPDQSLLDHTYSNVSHETADKDDTDNTAVPLVYANTQDIKPLSIEEVSEKRKRKAFLVAQEVMSSEKVFVDVLVLLCKDMKEQCRSDIPESELEKVITPLPQLLCLNEDILKDIKERINHWDTLPKISDVFIKKGPFLKLYSSYIQNFQAQCNFFDECCQKYLLFSKKVKEFEMSDYCKKLSVKHYMLKPIQRIPQYRLLLEDYLKYLEPGSEDYEDTEKALQIVRNVADHANKSMKQGDHLCKLLQIQSKLGNYELIKPGRIFIKEGELYKLSRRGLQERYFILLSDCLLYTSYYGTVSGLRVNYELPLNGMRVSLPQTEDYNNEFSIITITRSFTLRARSNTERQEWIDELQNAIKDNQQHLLSFLNRQLETQHSNDRQLGKVAPLWITDSRVSMCQQCTSIFTVTFRRHHCRACGRVVCGPCSDYEAPLQYQKFKNSRVCEECFHHLVKEFDDPESNMFERVRSVMNVGDEEVKQTLDIIRSYFKMGMNGSKKYHSKKIKKHVPQRLIEVTANDSGSQISGWLHKKSGRNWKRCWFVLKEQVLYRYKASEDIAALKSTPVLGYEVEELHEQDNFKYVFQLLHKGQDPLVFAVDNEMSYSRWIKAMEGATTLS